MWTRIEMWVDIAPEQLTREKFSNIQGKILKLLYDEGFRTNLKKGYLTGDDMGIYPSDPIPNGKLVEDNGYRSWIRNWVWRVRNRRSCNRIVDVPRSGS